MHFGPALQDIFPVLHGSEAHMSPSLQETQLPELQTMFVPHMVPSEAAVPVSTQFIVPVEQLYIPTWQRLVGMQLPPATQATHMPARQTLVFAVAPQSLPLATLPLSPQTYVPVEQDDVPVLQLFAGMQLMLLTQGLQVPALQTAVFGVVPQSLPFAAFPLSPQT
jgi:hypothetical protein